MTLDYLDFDYSEDTEGVGVFDAMATVRPEQIAAVHAEVEKVLGWANGVFAGRRGPVEDGGDWDYDLQELQEDAPGDPRHTVTLSVSGTEAFCAAFREAFELPG
ncbi:hypothetical protein [Variovorax sp. YR216]|uniref:hypothetical protein n=1 Tax=Variovorax sp. YR216 TaxID=1882828 RepID=UPI0008949038|nr:hypothetical protein [Variovorax sp. YR216]SEB22999.1 hypothetical protein SAMN05444680_11736 [Variovorax sp. YR216]